MNKIIMCLLCVCAACAAPVSPPNIADIIGTGGPVVLIVNSLGGACSAVVVDDNTLLTAKHCFVGAGEFNVWTAPPDALNPSPVSVADTYITSATYDVALVPLLWPLPPGTRHATFSHKTFRRGDTATVIGWGCQHLRAVEARSITYVDGHEFMTFAGIVCTGDSGGGIFDNDGAFVATTSFKSPDLVGRDAYVGAVSWATVVADLKLDAIASKQDL
jgi:hypothetical protein